MSHLYGIVHRSRGLLDVVEGTVDEAVAHAAKYTDAPVWLNGIQEPAYQDLRLAANRADAWYEAQPEHALLRTGLPQQLALMHKLSAPITAEDVFALYPRRAAAKVDYRDPGLIAAHQALLPFLPTEKFVKDAAAEDPNAAAKLRVAISQWQTPKGAVENLLRENVKLSKAPKTPRLAEQVRLMEKTRGMPKALGLSLVPHAMLFGADLGTTRASGIAGRYQLGDIDLSVDGVHVAGKPTLCAHATVECSRACLVHTGQNPVDAYNYVAKFALTRALYEQPLAFMRVLIESVARFSRSRDRTPFCRLNVFSDVPWELLFPDIFRLTPDLWFYDYTKVPGRAIPEDITNYDLTFSYSGRNKDAMLYELTKMNRRVAVVFLTEKHEVPKTWLGVPVVDGDESDFRPLDPPNAESGSGKPVIVALAFKDPWGNAKDEALKDINVFVVPCEREGGRVIAAQVPRLTHAIDGALIAENDEGFRHYISPEEAERLDVAGVGQARWRKPVLVKRTSRPGHLRVVKS